MPTDTNNGFEQYVSSMDYNLQHKQSEASQLNLSNNIPQLQGSLLLTQGQQQQPQQLQQLHQQLQLQRLQLQQQRLQIQQQQQLQQQHHHHHQQQQQRLNALPMKIFTPTTPAHNSTKIKANNNNNLSNNHAVPLKRKLMPQDDESDRKHIRACPPLPPLPPSLLGISEVNCDVVVALANDTKNTTTSGSVKVSLSSTAPGISTKQKIEPPTSSICYSADMTAAVTSDCVEGNNKTRNAVFRRNSLRLNNPFYDDTFPIAKQYQPAPTTSAPSSPSKENEVAELLGNHLISARLGPAHFGLRTMLRSWVATAIRKRSFALLGKAAKVALKCGISMDMLFCGENGNGITKDDKSNQNGMSFLPPLLFQSAVQQIVIGPTMTFDEITPQLLHAVRCGSAVTSEGSTEGERSIANRWISVRSINRGVTRWYVTPAFDRTITSRRDVQSAAEEWHQQRKDNDSSQQSNRPPQPKREFDVLDLFLPGREKNRVLRMLMKQFAMYPKPDMPLRPSFLERVMIRPRRVEGAYQCSMNNNFDLKNTSVQCPPSSSLLMEVDMVMCIHILSVDEALILTEFLRRDVIVQTTEPLPAPTPVFAPSRPLPNQAVSSPSPVTNISSRSPTLFLGSGSVHVPDSFMYNYQGQQQQQHNQSDTIVTEQLQDRQQDRQHIHHSQRDADNNVINSNINKSKNLAPTASAGHISTLLMQQQQRQQQQALIQTTTAGGTVPSPTSASSKSSSESSSEKLTFDDLLQQEKLNMMLKPMR